MNAIVLTGGTSKRFGSNKSVALLAGKSLLENLVSFLPEIPIIIVGPETPIAATYVREEPVHSGPVAAIAAAMKDVDSDTVAIFATDMPFAPLLLDELILAFHDDGVQAIDRENVPQPFCGIYKTEKLQNALWDFESVENQSMRGLMNKLELSQIVPSHAEYLFDIDTPDQLIEAEFIFEGLRK